MGKASRPLIGLLVGTVLFAVLWVVALKPSSSSNGGVGQYQGAVDAAHQAVQIANKVSAAQGGTVPSTTSATANTTPATSTTPGTSTTTTQTNSSSAQGHAATAQSPAKTVASVERALQNHKVLALLFYNPSAPDDRAVRSELDSLALRSSRLVKVAVPISQLSLYSSITNKVPVTVAPTLVIIDKRDQATSIVGFADSLEITQRVEDALAVL